MPDGRGLAVRAEASLDELRGEKVLLHPRDANPGHYDAVLELLRTTGVDPDVVVRDVSVDLQQTPVLDGRAIAIVGESTRVSLPPQLTWIPLRGPVTLEIRLLAKALNRAPAVDRFLATAESVADDFGWR